eukprot:scaffold70281_cov67-Cyclotella_meneghiniana.AAC.7
MSWRSTPVREKLILTKTPRYADICVLKQGSRDVNRVVGGDSKDKEWSSGSNGSVGLKWYARAMFHVVLEELEDSGSGKT